MARRIPNSGQQSPIVKTELTEPIEAARVKLQARIEEGEAMRRRQITTPEGVQQLEHDHQAWTDYNEELLHRLFTTGELRDQYASRYTAAVAYYSPPTIAQQLKRQWDKLDMRLGTLRSIDSRLQLYAVPAIEAGVSRAPVASDESSRTNSRSPLEVLERLVNRFHLVAQQLRDRHAGKPTLDVADEYDVQDLLHALLLLEFEDVRPEEYTPTYAGGSARMDFLLKAEQIVIEVKHTRPGLGAREIGEQLLIDVGKYQAHPDCKLLFCFVYDPTGRVANPRGLESDLSGDKHALPTRVRIRPRFS